jgi:hypothetical protein
MSYGLSEGAALTDLIDLGWSAIPKVRSADG